MQWTTSFSGSTTIAAGVISQLVEVRTPWLYFLVAPVHSTIPFEFPWLLRHRSSAVRFPREWKHLELTSRFSTKILFGMIMRLILRMLFQLTSLRVFLGPAEDMWACPSTSTCNNRCFSETLRCVVPVIARHLETLDAARPRYYDEPNNNPAPVSLEMGFENCPKWSFMGST